MSDIRWAVTFREAARTGVIKHPAPVNAVMEAFGLASRRTLEEWCTRYKAHPVAIHHGEGEVIREWMLRAGKRFSAANARTTKAILQRARKKAAK
jgi:hypothetical protein